MVFAKGSWGWMCPFFVLGRVLPAAGDPVDGLQGERASVPEVENQGRVDRVKALPCRPTIACTAEIVPAGAWEIESGYSDRKAAGANSHGGQLLVKYSATDHLQLQLATNNAFALTPSTGSRAFFDGGFAGPKVQFTHQGTYLPMLAVSAFIAFPTKQGDQAIQQTYDAYFWAYASKDIGFAHADLNAGLNILDVYGAAKPQGVVAWSWSSDIAYGLGIMTEGYGYFGGPAPIADAGWLNAISYSPIPEVIFDIGGDVGLAGVDRAYTIFAGATFVPYRYQRGNRVSVFANNKPVTLAPLPVVAQPSPPRSPVIASLGHP